MRLAAREALLSFRRAPSLSALSIVTIGFALFVISLFGLVALNLRVALSDIEERVEVVAYLTRGTPVDAAMAAYADIETFPEVESVLFVTEDEALVRAKRELVEFQGLFGDLATNPLPASLEIRLTAGHRDEDSVADVARRLEGFRFVEDVRFGRDWIARLDRIREIGAVVGFVIGGAFAMAAVIIIGTTIRMAVIQRAAEIGIMRLVGATDGFIRMPFLLEGMLKGALGGLLALGLNYGVHTTVNRTLMSTTFFDLNQSSIIVLVGILLGFVASSLSVRRHLKKV